MGRQGDTSFFWDSVYTASHKTPTQ